MKLLSKLLKKLMTLRFKKGFLRLAYLFLMTSMLLCGWPTTSSAVVKQTASNQVTMSGTDLYTLINKLSQYKAQAEATQEALTSERKAHQEYVSKVNDLIKAQDEERQTYKKQLKSLERRLNAPAIEAYGGYGTGRQWEGGIRFVVRL